MLDACHNQKVVWAEVKALRQNLQKYTVIIH